MALATRFSVSAAKPTTRAGRWGPGLDSVARMSGLGTSSREGGAAPAFFLILAGAAWAAFQSATAAGHTGISILPAARQAPHIWAAESRRTGRSPGGAAGAARPLA